MANILLGLFLYTGIIFSLGVAAGWFAYKDNFLPAQKEKTFDEL